MITVDKKEVTPLQAARIYILRGIENEAEDLSSQFEDGYDTASPKEIKEIFDYMMKILTDLDDTWKTTKGT